VRTGKGEGGGAKQRGVFFGGLVWGFGWLFVGGFLVWGGGGLLWVFCWFFVGGGGWGGGGWGFFFSLGVWGWIGLMFLGFAGVLGGWRCFVVFGWLVWWFFGGGLSNFRLGLYGEKKGRSTPKNLREKESQGEPKESTVCKKKP